MADNPKIQAVLDAQMEDQNSFAVHLGASDGKAYWFRFTEAAAQQLVASHQRMFLASRAVSRLMLTVERSETALSVNGDAAIVFRTKEIGEFAIALPPDAIATLQAQLSELRATPTTTGAKQ